MGWRLGYSSSEEEEEWDENILVHKTNKIKSFGPKGRLVLSVPHLNINYIHLAVNFFKQVTFDIFVKSSPQRMRREWRPKFNDHKHGFFLLPKSSLLIIYQ